MKSRKIFPCLTPLVLAALLLSFAPASAMQRRRRPARTPARTTSPAPTHTPAQTTPTPAPSQTTAPQTQVAPVRADAQARRAEPERAIEELLSADGYGVYAEVKRVGVLVRSEEVRAAVGMLTLLGDEVRPATQPVTDLFNFVSENAEALAEARAVVTFMPTRAGLPQTLVALELPSAETAAAFEPKFRHLVGQESDSLQSILGARPVARGASTRKPAPGEMNVRGAARSAAEKGADAQGFAVKRYGRLLLAADSAFTFKRLRGEEGLPALADNARFQSVRSRFGADSVFVYVDTTLAQQGYAVQEQKAQEARDADAKQAIEQYGAEARKAQSVKATEQNAAAPSPSPTPGATPSEATARATTNAIPAASPTPATTSTPTSDAADAAARSTPAPSPSASASPQEDAGAQATPMPEQPTDEELSAASAAEQANAPTVEEKKAGATGISPSKPSAEQVTVQRMGGLTRSLWDGAPRIPGAVALGLRLDGDSLAVRLAVENTPDGVVSIIPFLPNIIAGPPVTAEAAQVAPEDGDIFFATSLDWTQIYNNTLGTASLNLQRLSSTWHDTDEDSDAAVFKPSAGEKAPTAEEAVAAAEKLFGFSFKDDLLPSLGNEVAVSLPLKSISGSSIIRGIASEKNGEKESDAEPGIAFIVTLNNPDKVREILPRVLTALNFVSYGSSFAPPEKRQGFEIRAGGGVAYAILDNFLVVCEGVKAVRHVVDSYAARRTLAASQTYRDATDWQARQKLAHLYVSEELMRSAAENTKKISGGSTDPVVRGLLAQLDVRPEPASYAATKEGDVIVHEVRVPVSLIRVEAVSLMVGVRDARAVSGEMMAIFALNQIADAENTFKRDKKKERYGTLEELVGERLVEKEFVAHLEYAIELNAVGDRFEARATPKSYGKTGRRSFFVDENGAVRGADHKGQPASADDPPID